MFPVGFIQEAAPFEGQSESFLKPQFNLKLKKKNETITKSMNKLIIEVKAIYYVDQTHVQNEP